MMAISQENDYGEVFLNEEKATVNLLQTGEPRVNSDVWYLDNGASNHMTGDRSKFHELDESVSGRVKFGDGSTVAIMGKGSVLFDCKNGDQRLLNENAYDEVFLNEKKVIANLLQTSEPRVESDVWHHDNVASNHMTGHRSKFHELDKSVSGRVKFGDGLPIAIIEKGLVLFDFKNGHSTCLLATRDEPAWLWHSRLGHVNFYSLRRLVEKNMASGVPMITHPNQVCEGCVLAKQTRIPFPEQAVFRAKKPLELVHADLCGPITPTTVGGSKYFLLLVDDFSMWSWVYMLIGKFEAFDAFKQYKKMVEESSGYKVKTLRTDHGGEFTSKDFAKFCEENGIARHLTAPYSPQQNGVVERRNLTVMEMARSLLKGINVPGKFWGGHLKKLDYRSKKMVYFGVEDGTKGRQSWSWTKSEKEQVTPANTFTIITQHITPVETPQNSPETTHDQPENPEFETVFSGQPYPEDVQVDSDPNIAALDPFSSPSSHSSNSPNATGPKELCSFNDFMHQVNDDILISSRMRRLLGRFDVKIISLRNLYKFAVFQVKTFTFIGIRLFHLVGDEVVGGGEVGLMMRGLIPLTVKILVPSIVHSHMSMSSLRGS
ncbi:retrotransposon protein, putative, unclassified [Tanacetum coccineum]|uniref:Retrotransposon protein, putative, unclassified n=1 Tax=Tanacetum coccineum TaxID=301880 RepID=A0ABQ4ZZM4_9ASTR